MTGDKKDDGAPTIEDCVLLSDMNAFQENVKSWITEGAKKTNKTLSTITQTLVSLTDRMDAIEKRHPAPTEEGDVSAASHKKSTAKDDNDEEEDLDEEEEEGETEQQRRLRLRLQHNRFGMGGKKGGNKGNNFRDDDPFAKREKELQGRQSRSSRGSVGGSSTFTPRQARTAPSSSFRQPAPPSPSSTAPRPAVTAPSSRVPGSNKLKPPAPTTSSSSIASTGRTTTGIRCHKCQGIGHVQKECPSKRAYIATEDGGYISTSDVEEDIDDMEETNEDDGNDGDTLGSEDTAAYRSIIVQRVLSARWSKPSSNSATTCFRFSSSSTTDERAERVHHDARERAEFILKLHATTKENIEKMTAKYRDAGSKGRKELKLEPGDLVWLHLRKDHFPDLRKSKLMPRADGPFKIIEKINDNAYKLELPPEFGI
ncbi:hypothetical protein U9M48_019308 [Paspalum notatum var. saurae]|uniref:CCHC-type domain-containing protein n=1 Tax=Paspalum notatum var. saurae TaxID=547442 RepID=A0AAQ3TB81_PASNO